MASFQTVYVPVDASEAREIEDLIRAQQQFLLWRLWTSYRTAARLERLSTTCFLLSYL
jgi:hypothetical protein